MQRLEVSGAVRLIYRSLGVKGLKKTVTRQQILISPPPTPNEIIAKKNCCSSQAQT